MTKLASIARRHRLGHAILFAVTVCLLVATAAVDPLLTRSFSQSLVVFHEQAQRVIGSQVSLQSGGQTITPLQQMERAVDPRVRAVVGSPTESTSVRINDVIDGELVLLQSTHGQCRHVHLVRGRCPTARNEVIVSTAAVAHSSHLKVGAQLRVTSNPPQEIYDDKGRPLPPPHLTMNVVGIFTAPQSDRFWGGAAVGAYTPPPAPPGIPGPSEYWLTADASFLRNPPMVPPPLKQGEEPNGIVPWPGITHTVSYPVDAGMLTPDTLRAAVAGLRPTQQKAGDNVAITESLSAVYAATHVDLGQVGQILPFLLVQLGIVLLILLVQVTSFFATVRRGEAAVLKMRGNGTAGVVRLGAREFLPSYIVGTLAGLCLAYVVDGLVRHLWLPGNVGASWNWTALLVLPVIAVLVAVVWFLCWLVMARESISALLRARPQRRRGARLSMPAAVVAVVCLVGVVLTATKSLTGAPVQVTPVLLAGLVATVVAALLAPVAARLVRRLLARGRPAGALAVAQLGRRSGVATALATLIITSALFALSVSVFARGAENRAARAAADLGAPALVHATVGPGAVNGQSLMNAVSSVDPHHQVFTPSVEINASSPISNAVVGVIPADMERIGTRTGLADSVPWAALGNGGSASAPNAVVGTWTTKSAVGSTVSGPTMADVDGDFRVAGSAPYIPGVPARTIVVDLATMLKAGDRQDNLSYQVFSKTQDPKQLARLDAALHKAGFASADVRTIHGVRAGYDATATAWAMNLSIVVSALSVLAALTSVVLVAVASRSDRRRDLRALRTGGVPHTVLRRATVGEFVLLAFVGSAIGAATAPVAAWLTGRTMLWWSTPPDEPLTRTGFQWQVGSTAAVGLIVLLMLVGAGFGTRLAQAAGRNGGRWSA
ncbi:FtsX-like permease family protein [Flexivirga alba]|uniref:FtsX-like permease family protein n=1 Tax=Flexivirga alba TaxID=702742 RepID=A0ABW2AAV4_9MICO